MRRLLDLGIALLLLGGPFALILPARGDPALEREVVTTFEGASHDLDPDWYARSPAPPAVRTRQSAFNPSAEVIETFMSSVEPSSSDQAPWDSQPTPEAHAAAHRSWPAEAAIPRDRFTERDIIWLLVSGAVIAFAVGRRLGPPIRPSLPAAR